MTKKLKITVNGKFENLRTQIAGIPERIEQTGEVIYSDRNTIYRTGIGGIDATVKSFHVPAFFNRIVYSTLRHSKARRSYDNALRLQELGIGTPEPIAYIEEYESGLLSRSYYICRMFEGQNIRHWETEISDYRPMIKALAALIVDLHGKGVMHKDFSPGNILFKRNADGGYRFALIDINRMQFGVTSRQRLYRNFRCLNIDSERETARVAEEYATIAGLDPAELGGEAVRLLRAYHRGKARNRRLKRLLGKKKR